MHKAKQFVCFKSSNTNHCVLISLLIMLLFWQSNTQAITYTLDSLIINAVTNYEIGISDNNLNTGGITGIIRMTFPTSQYSLGTANYTCKETTSGISYTCINNGSGMLYLNYPATGTRSSTYNLKIFGIANPSNTAQTIITYEFLYTNLTRISLNNVTPIRNFQPDALTACSITYSPNTVLSTSQAIITLTLKNSVGAGGGIALAFPTNWANPPDTTNYSPVISSATQVYAAISGSSLSTSVTPFVASQSISLSAVFNTTAAAGSVISFSITQLMAPPTVFTNNSVTITTKSSGNLGNIDQSSCTVSGITTQSFTLLSTNPTSLAIYLGTDIPLTFNMTVSLPLVQNDIFQLSINSDSSSLVTLFANSSFGSFDNQQGFSITQSNSSLLLLGANLFITQSPGVMLGILNGIALRSFFYSGVRNLSLLMTRGGSAYATGSFSVTIKPNSLYNITILPLSSIVSLLTTYTFTFTTFNGLGVGAMVKITLPIEISISNSSGSTCSASVSSSTSPASISSSVSCTILSSRILTISSISTALLAMNTILSINVNNIINPTTTKPSSNFLIQTFYNSSFSISSVDDTSLTTGLTITALSATIQDANITTDNLQNNQLANYILSYKIKTIFPSNGVILITIPNQIAVPNLPSCRFIIVYSNGTNTSSQITTAAQGTTIIAGITVNTLSFNSISALPLSSNTIIQITISTLRNAKSFRTTSSFGIYVYTTDNYLIQSIASSSTLTLTNTQTNTFSALSSLVSNTINGKSIIYTINLQSAVTLNAADVLTVELQTTNNVDTQMYIKSPFTCQFSYVNALNVQINQMVPCALETSMRIKITLNISILSSTVYQLSVDSLILARTMSSPSNIFLKTYESNAGTLYSITSDTLITSSNSNLNLIKSIGLSITTNPSQLNQLQSFSLNVVPTNNFLSGDYFVVFVPTAYLYVPATAVTAPANLSSNLAASICDTTVFFCSNYNNNVYQIKVQEIIKGSFFTNISSASVNIKLGFYRSPLPWSFSSATFTVSTFSSSTLAIDSTQLTTDTSLATFYLSCSNSNTYHCKTCSTNLTCLTCYAPNDGYTNNYNFQNYNYITTAGVCVTSCPANFFNNSNVCTQCTSPCLTCEISSTHCLSCDPSTNFTKYNAANFTCLNSCPVGYFSDSANKCIQCDSTCKTCSGISTFCLSCTSPLFYSSTLNSCVNSSSCNTNQYGDSSTNKCTNCDTSCNGCSFSSTNCTQCATGYIILSNSSGNVLCTNSCPTGTVNNTALTGTGGCMCSSVCKTCVTSINSCTSCNTNLFLYLATCVNICPSQYYYSNASGIATCVICSTPSCKTCANDICTECLATYSLSLNLCTLACPSSTFQALINNIRQCVSCSLGCTSCTSSNSCSQCNSNLMLQANSTNIYCTSSCSTGYVSFNGSNCMTNCPTGYTNVSNVCQINNTTNNNTNNSTNNTTNNSTNSTTNQTLSSTSSTRVIPFPLTIAVAVACTLSLASKVALPISIVAASLCAFLGFLQVITWIILILIVAINQASQSLVMIGVYLILVAVGLNLALNIINIVFFNKYIWNEPNAKFQYIYQRLAARTKTGKCMTWTIFVFSIAFSHKVTEILFSNIFGASYFVYKVNNVSSLTPLNIIRYISFIPSLFAIAGGCLINYQHQTDGISSYSFTQSVDCIVVTILALIVTIWVTIRKADDYEKNLEEMQSDQDALENDGLGPNQINQIILEEGGLKGRNQYYVSSIRKTANQDDRNNPIAKKNTAKVKPFDQNNITGAPFEKDNDDLDRIDISSALDKTQLKIVKIHKRIESEELSISEIQVGEDSGLNLMPSNTKSPINKQILNNSQSKSDFQLQAILDSQKNVENLTEKEKKNIKNNIENKLTSEEIQKTKVIKQVDQISNLNSNQGEVGSETNINSQNKLTKIQKLDEIAKSQEEDLHKLPENQQEKAGNIKDALNILEAKKIKIPEYLLYLDIIEEEDQDKDSNLEEQKLSPIKRKTSKQKQKLKIKPQGQRYSHKKDPSSRKKDHDLVMINHTNGQIEEFDEEDEPKIPDFKKNLKKNMFHTESQEDPFSSQEFKTSGLNRGKNNRSEQLLNTKKNKLKDLKDLQIINISQSGNRQASFGEQFQRGKILQEDREDQMPPSNLHSTSYLGQNNQREPNFNSVPIQIKQKVGEIQLIQSDGNDIETLKEVQQDYHHFNSDDVSPSQFNVQNQRIQIDEISQVPTKPKVYKKKMEQKGHKIGQPVDLEEEEKPDEDYDEFERRDEPISNQIQNPLGRYGSEGRIDYDSIILNKQHKQRIKDLQQIYLPRLDVRRTNQQKKHQKRGTSRNSKLQKEDN